MKVRTKPVEVEATRWFADGDHEAVRPVKNLPCNLCDRNGRKPNADGKYTDHGSVKPAHDFDPIFVCPGDWIVQDDRGSFRVVSSARFDELYEKPENKEQG